MPISGQNREKLEVLSALGDLVSSGTKAPYTVSQISFNLPSYSTMSRYQLDLVLRKLAKSGYIHITKVGNSYGIVPDALPVDTTEVIHPDQISTEKLVGVVPKASVEFYKATIPIKNLTFVKGSPVVKIFRDKENFPGPDQYIDLDSWNTGGNVYNSLEEAKEFRTKSLKKLRSDSEKEMRQYFRTHPDEKAKYLQEREQTRGTPRVKKLRTKIYLSKDLSLDQFHRASSLVGNTIGIERRFVSWGESARLGFISVYPEDKDAALAALSRNGIKIEKVRDVNTVW